MVSYTSVSLTIEDLAILKLANVSHGNSVTSLGSRALSELLVIDLHAIDLLDTEGSSGLVSGLLSGLLVLTRGSGSLLEVLCELDLLVRLGLLLGLNWSSLTVVLLQLLLLLLAQGFAVGGGLVLGHEVIETLSGALVLSLGLNEFRSFLLFLVAVDLGDARVLQAIELVILVILVHQILEVEFILVGREVVLIVLIILILVVGSAALVCGDDIVTGQEDSVSTGDLEEDTLVLRDGDVQSLLALLH